MTLSGRSGTVHDRAYWSRGEVFCALYYLFMVFEKETVVHDKVHDYSKIGGSDP